ncbi:MAG: hypothetical protein WC833_14240 [Bacteroidales bacterium]|jgi:bacteriocin-like protein
MKATFEKLNEQEMINVNGGEITVIMVTDRNGNVYYVIIEDGN